MSTTININNLSLCHRNSGGFSAATLPDVCLTPPLPIPIPYPNIARETDLAKGTTTVSADGGNMCANYGSEFSKSTGDEPGTDGGVISGTNMKEATWITHSFDVKLEGKGACRLTDKMFHNHGNTVNLGGKVHNPVAGEAPPPCSAEQMKANLLKCDGGTGVWKKAKAAMGRAPGIEVSKAAGGFGGHADAANKKVVIAPNPDCCGATQTLIFELTNLSNAAKFSKIGDDAYAGKLGRENYTKANEALEYQSVKNSYTSFEKCHEAWGCAEGALARHGGYKSAKDFDDYYDHYLPESHKNYWRDAWDKNFKSNYESKTPKP